MLCHDVSSFVVGTALPLFSVPGFLNGAVIFFPILLLFVPMFLYLSLVRHPKYNKISGSITIAVLSLAAWIFLAPVSYKTAHDWNALEKSPPAELSSGYFRRINGALYYFTLVTGNYVSGIKIDGDYFSKSNQENSFHALDSKFMNFKRDKMGFSDPIISENLTPPTILQNALRALVSIHESASAACDKGKIEWLFFCSIMAALVSLGAILSASEWKLADAFYVTFDTFAILALNSLFFMGYFDQMVSSLRDAGPFFEQIAKHFQCALNCAMIFLSASLGIFKAVVHAAKRARGAQ